jgi:hypothetical protein
MAKAKAGAAPNGFRAKAKTTRPGVHSKKKNSSHKRSKNYRKKYKGQGK